MGNYAGNNTFHENVYIISHGDLVDAGITGKTARAVRQLTDRTSWIKNNIENDLLIEALHTAGSAGLVAISQGDGTLKMQSITAATSANHHGDLTGLADDDHTQYVLVDGSRAFTAPVSGIDPNTSTELTTKNYVDTQIAVVSGADSGLYVSNFGSGHVTAAVPAISGSVSENITGFGQRGTMVGRINILPSTDCDSYDVEIFREDTFTTRQYFLDDVTTSESAAVLTEDFNFMLFDDDNTGEIHIKITNNDPVTTPTFTIEIEGMTIRS